MPSNINEIIRGVQSLKKQMEGRGKRSSFKATSSKKLTPIKNTITSANVDTAVTDSLDNIYSQIVRRLMELLSVDTPKKTGKLNGGWTSTGKPIENRLNNSNSAIPAELANIFSLASDGTPSISITNAVEYARAVNNGSKTNRPRAFVEMAISQLQKEAKTLGVTIIVNGSS